MLQGWSSGQGVGLAAQGVAGGCEGAQVDGGWRQEGSHGGGLRGVPVVACRPHV